MTDFDVECLSKLVRSVVACREQIRDTGHGMSVDGSPEHIVFDIDVDGERYLLIKKARVERRVLTLSPREREIVRMVALGHQNKVIAAVLNISAWTVCTHVRRIFTKLGVTSRAAMVAKVSEFRPAETTDHLDSPHGRRPTYAGNFPARLGVLPTHPGRSAAPASKAESKAETID